MGDHDDSRARDQKQQGDEDRGPENAADGPDADPETDNPLAHVDLDRAVVGAAGNAKGLVNDPADDPLWNPAMEPQTPQDSRAAHPAGSGSDARDDDAGPGHVGPDNADPDNAGGNA